MKLKQENEGKVFNRKVGNINIEFNTNIKTQQRFEAFHDNGFADLFECECDKCDKCKVVSIESVEPTLEYDETKILGNIETKLLVDTTPVEKPLIKKELKAKNNNGKGK